MNCQRCNAKMTLVTLYVDCSGEYSDYQGEEVEERVWRCPNCNLELPEGYDGGPLDIVEQNKRLAALNAMLADALHAERSQMTFYCPSCGETFSATKGNVTPGARAVRCSTCETNWLVDVSYIEIDVEGGEPWKSI